MPLSGHIAESYIRLIHLERKDFIGSPKNITKSSMKEKQKEEVAELASENRSYAPSTIY